MELTHRPIARTQDLIVEELGDELLVYDEADNRGHCLSPSAARVWRLCDGRTPVEDMGAELGLDPHEVDRALAELEACELLQPTPQLSSNGDGVIGTTRRELSVKLVKAGGAIAAAPLIVSIAAPSPAAAATAGPGCTNVLECSGNCGQTGSGCQGGGCVCCQLTKINCEDNVFCNGVHIFRSSSIKFCQFVNNACPPRREPCICPNPEVCPGTASSSSGKSGTTQSTQSSSSSTGTTTSPSSPAPVNTPGGGAPAPSTGPAAGGTTPTTPAPTPTTPAPTPTTTAPTTPPAPGTTTVPGF
jgi:cell division septation protein DedD